MGRALVLLICLIAWGLVMLVHGWSFSVDKNASIAGVKNSPGLAMEFARSAQEATQLLGPASDATGRTNRRVMETQQYLDFVYIPLYWAFFFFVLSSPMRQSGPRTVGWLAGAFITIAAVSDIFEDAGILKILDPAYQGSFVPYGFAVLKWVLIFLVMGLVMRFPFTYMPGTAAPSWIAWPTSIALLTGSILGVAGVGMVVLRSQGGLFQLAALVLLIAFIFLLLFLVALSKTVASRPPRSGGFPATEQGRDIAARSHSHP